MITKPLFFIYFYIYIHVTCIYGMVTKLCILIGYVQKGEIKIIYIYVCTHTHIYIHTYIYTHTNPPPPHTHTLWKSLEYINDGMYLRITVIVMIPGVNE